MQRTKLVTLTLAVAVLGLLVWRVRALPILSSTLALAPGIPFAANAPMGYDPLSAQEETLASTAALQAQEQSTLQSAATNHLELLLVERHEISKVERALGKWPRQADVYLYDYASDTLLHSIVDVTSGAIVSQETATGVQLPLTEAEETRALDLVRNDRALWSALADHYQTITGQALTDLAQLQVKVSLFRADSMPDQVNLAATNCGQHRCAQALLFTTDKTLLEIMPIVDLSHGNVVQVLRENE